MTDTPDRGSSLARSLASSWLALGIGVAVSFFLSPFVVNKLGAAWYGVWALAGQFTGYLYLLDFGVRESVIRYTSKYAARRQGTQLNRILTTALVIYGLVALLALAIVAVCVWRAPYWFNLEQQYWSDARWAIALTGLTIVQTFVFNVFSGVLLGLQRWDIGNAVGIASNLLRATLIVVFLLQGNGIVAVAAVQFAVSLLSGIVIAIVSVVLLRGRSLAFRPVRLGARRFVATARRVLGYGFYVIVNNVGEKVITATDAIVVGVFLPVYSVAYYAIAGSLVGYLRSLLSATAQVFNPLASHLHTMRQPRELRAAFMLGAKTSVLLALPVACAFVVVGQEFIGLWMGPEFAKPSGEVLAILAVAAILSAPQYVLSSVLYGMSRHRVIAWLRIGEAIANLALSITLVQRIGLVGVALGTAIPNLVVVMLVLPQVTRRIVGIGLWEYYEKVYLRPAAAIVPFAVVAWWLRDAHKAANLAEFFLQMAALTLLYAPCAFALVLDKSERRYVLRRFGLWTAPG